MSYYSAKNTLQVKEPYASNIYFRNYLQMSMELDNDNDNDIYFNLHKLILHETYNIDTYDLK